MHTTTDELQHFIDDNARQMAVIEDALCGSGPRWKQRTFWIDNGGTHANMRFLIHARYSDDLQGEWANIVQIDLYAGERLLVDDLALSDFDTDEAHSIRLELERQIDADRDLRRAKGEAV